MTTFQDLASEQKRMRWDGNSRPHYEEWCTTLNLAASGAGFWLRHAIHAPEDAIPHVEVTFASYVPGAESANVTAGAVYPLSQFHAQKPPFGIAMGPNRMEVGRMTGMLEAGDAPVVWDLVFDCVTDPLDYLAGAIFENLEFFPQLVTPHPFLSVGGRIEVGDHRFHLDRDSGQQSHLWGSRRPSEYAWFHCSSFAQSGGEPIPAYVTGLTTRLRLAGGILLPPASIGHLVWGGRHVRIAPASEWRHRWEGPWIWKGKMEEEAVSVILSVPWENMVLAEIRESAERTIFCHHTGLSDCAVQFNAPRRAPQRFETKGRTHVEIGSTDVDIRAKRELIYDRPPPANRAGEGG